MKTFHRDRPGSRLALRGVKTPSLGFGGAAIGNLYQPVSDEDAKAAVAAAWDAGVRYFDVAPHYGFGLAEQRLGDALAELDGVGEALISTKVGRVLKPVDAAAVGGERHGFIDAAPFEPVFDYSYDGVMSSFEASLGRLRRDTVDILLAHDLGAVTHGEAHADRWAEFMGGGYRAMLDLRDAGRVRAIGLGANEWQVCAQALSEGDFDVFLLAGRYTLLEQTALDSFLPACVARAVDVIIGGPFNSGVLAGEDAESRYDYGAAPDWVVERVEALRAVCRAWNTPLAAAALQFPLAHPAVASVIPGVADADQARIAIGHMARGIPEGFWQALREQDLVAPDAPLPAARFAPVAMSPVILLHPDDDVVVCRAAVAAASPLTIDGRSVIAAQAVEVGHKIARHDLKVGDPVRKYGAHIGSMTAAVPAGGHVHLHNMKSDYIATHNRESASRGGA